MKDKQKKVGLEHKDIWKFFYKDFYFDYSYVDNIAILHDRTVPVHNYFRISFDISKYSSKEIKQMYIARKNKYGKLSYVGSRHKNGEMYASIKSLGQYTLTTDLEKPKVYHYNFKTNQNLSKKRYLLFYILAIFINK